MKLVRGKDGRFKKGSKPWTTGLKNPWGSKEKHPRWKGGKKELICVICGNKFFQHQSKSSRKYCSQKCYGKSKKGKPNIYSLGKPRYDARGSNNPRWKGGDCPSKRYRKLLEWKVWRKAVFERDKYTCQECGIVGSRLHPHHIKSKKDYPELIFDIHNGITLCEKCHYNKHRIRKGNQI